MGNVYWGLQTTYPSGFTAQWNQLVSDAARVPSLGHIGTQQWSSGASFSAIQTQCNNIRAQGAHPALDWFTTLSGSTSVATSYNNQAIITGTYDTYLNTWFSQCAAWGLPILIFFCSEMNGTWYPAFSDFRTDVGNSAGSFKAMWIHVHNLAVANGATNIKWAMVWNIQSSDGSGAATAETTQPMSQFFPGTSYVDVIGLDGFNYAGGGDGGSPGPSGNNWYTFDQIFDGGVSGLGNSYTHLSALDASIPLAIGSFGTDSREGKDTNASWATAPKVNGTKKAAWWTDVATQLAGKYSRVAVWRQYDLDHDSKSPYDPGAFYANGYSLRNNDSAFQTPTSTAVGGTFTSPDSGRSMVYTVTGGSASQTAFRALVAGSNHVTGGTFSLASLAIPYGDTYLTAERAAGGINLELRLGDASKANTATAADTSGNSLNGTYTGTTASDVTGIPATTDHAWQTDGTDYVVVADNNLLSPQVGGKIWIGFWYKLSALPTATVTFVAKGGSGSNQWEYSIDLSAALQWRWFLLTNTGTVAIGATATLSPSLNTWHRVDCAFDSTLADGNSDKAVMYHDGSRLAGGSTIGANVLTNGTSGLYVGRRGDNTNTLGTVANPAQMDEVRLHNVYPTAAQILSLYNAGAADVTPPTVSSVSVGSITTTGATITWSTDEIASTQVQYGTTSAYGTTTAETNTSPRVTSHSVALSGLSAGTVYHYQVISRDAAGNVGTSTDATFTTTAATLTIGTPTLGPVGPTTVVVTWSAATGGIQPVTYAVQRAPNVGGSPGTYTTITFGLTGTTYTAIGLSPTTTYWFRVQVTDSTPTTVTSTGASATTSGVPVSSTVLPSVLCELSLSDPTAGPQWTDITPYLKSFSVSRGRTFELDRMDVGTATVVLDNSDGRFDPQNTAGPYYGSLYRYRRIRIRALWNNGVYPIFSGYIAKFPQKILSVFDAETPIPLVDGFGVLAQCMLNTTYSVEMSNVRIGHVLDEAEWTTGSAWKLGDSTLSVLGSTTVLGPVGDRQIQIGQSQLDAITLSDVSALQHLQDVQTTEDGWIFCSADGAFVFYGRNRRLSQAAYGTLALFGDRPTPGGELMYVDVVRVDDTPIYNTVTVTRQASGAVTQSAQDATSRGRYFIQSLPLQTLLASDTIAASMASYYVNRYKAPTPRISSLTLDGTGDPTRLWPQILGRELAEPITVRVRPVGMSLIEQPSWIEGIEHSWTAEGGDWATVWHLSPIDQSQYWILGASALGVGTKLGIY